MPTREIGFGLYDVCRPTTSPTRKGAPKGRPQPRSFNQHTASLAPATHAPPSPPPPAAPSGPRRNAHHRSAECAVAQRVAAPVSAGPVRGAATAVLRATTAPTAKAQDEPSRSTGHTHLIASASQPSPVAHASASAAAFSTVSSYLEDRIRCVVHAAGSHALLSSFLAILQAVVRLLQQDRAQRKGQQPRRRLSGVKGNDMESKVASCLTQAAQATSLASAAALLEQFLVAHTAASSSPPSAPASAADTTQAACSPVVLLGVTLAELYFDGCAPSCAVSPSSLFTYLDAAVAAGHPGAMVCVGACLRDGRGGVEQNVKAGLAWLLCAASTGYLPAMHELGETYEVGVPQQPSSPPLSPEAEEGVDVDWGEAMRWYQQAAEAGYAPSQLNLGKLLLLAAEQGLLDKSADPAALEQLNAAAKRWLEACAAAGVEEGVRLLKRMK